MSLLQGHHQGVSCHQFSKIFASNSEINTLSLSSEKFPHMSFKFLLGLLQLLPISYKYQVSKTVGNLFTSSSGRGTTHSQICLSHTKCHQSKIDFQNSDSDTQYVGTTRSTNITYMGWQLDEREISKRVRNGLILNCKKK